MEKTIYLVKSLVFGLFVIGCFVACSSDSTITEEVEEYVPVDGERISHHDGMVYTFINGGTEVELTRIQNKVKGGHYFLSSQIWYNGKGYNVTQIGEDACQDVYIDNIPEGVVSIGKNAFHGNLAAYIQLPSTLRSIGDIAFWRNKNLKEIVIPYGVTVIGQHAFYKDSLLSTVTIPNSVIEIGSGAFSETGIEKLTLPGSLKETGYKSFGSCPLLTEVTIEEGVKIISQSTFGSCEKLEKVSLPQSLTIIGESAFWGCNITSITIPENVDSIGRNAFYDVKGVHNGIPFSNDKLREVISMIKVPIPITGVFGSNFLQYGTLYVPKGTIELYKNTEGWRDIRNIVEHSY